MNIKKAQTEALKQINTTFKLSEIGYGQGYHEGQMNERKYWKDKIKAKIEEYKKQIEKMEKDDVGIGFTLGKEWSDLKAKVEFGQSLLEKEI